MSLRPLALGLAATSLLPPALAMGNQEQTTEAISFVAETDKVTDRLQTFLAKLSESEGRVEPMTTEIRFFSERGVAQGMLVRYRSFSDQWWDHVNTSNQARARGTSLILPTEPTKDPIFTEMIVPIVRGMELSPTDCRKVLEDYRYRTSTGLRVDMERLFETQLKPIAPYVLRGNPQALVEFEAFKTDFDALEERFMLFQYLDFAQILGIEREQFEEVTTAQEEVAHYSKTLKIPNTLEKATPILKEVSGKLDEYQKRLDQYAPNCAEYDDMLQAIMMLMELQTRLTSMVLDQVGTPDVQGATIVGNEFEIILKAPHTPHGRFELEVNPSTWETETDGSSDVYSGQWSKWAEWYSTTFYYLAMRHFDKQRAEATQQGLEHADCTYYEHGNCANVPFDPIEAWTDSLLFAQQALIDDNPIQDIDRFAPTEPPIYRSTGVDFDFPTYSIVVHSYHVGGRETTLNIADEDLVFPAYCEQIRNPYSFTPNMGTHYYSYGTSGHDEWHFPIVFEGFHSAEPEKCETTYYDPQLFRHVTFNYCTPDELPLYPGGRRWFARTDERLAVLGDLEAMTVGFCTAEKGFKPTVDRILGFSDTGGGTRLYASCITDGCEGRGAEHTVPVEFFEQLAREKTACDWGTTAAMK